ncbi:hypothetical protein CEXT_103111 [Caerostris extrusa]|uniref:Uncharacterized protein n=1 Tax=Caerostris extrusa TaxID=172846 RepID=A0AAV4X376_CAEEX|nr:hypothetical protein CEXT_103111 [Caerostris extrusa]
MVRYDLEQKVFMNLSFQGQPGVQRTNKDRHNRSRKALGLIQRNERLIFRALGLPSRCKSSVRSFKRQSAKRVYVPSATKCELAGDKETSFRALPLAEFVTQHQGPVGAKMVPNAVQNSPSLLRL